MFKLIFGAISSFLSVIGSIIVFVFLFVLFEDEIIGIFISFILTILVIILVSAGMILDKSLRKKFNLLHEKYFSLLWSVISIIELSLLFVLIIVFSLGLITIAVLIYDLLIYLILSIWILSSKIKKLLKR